MKKTLVSILSGLVVIGSASAIPTPDTARENCMKLEQEGTHVWVSKDSTCIPINPCAEDASPETNKKYCLEFGIPTEKKNQDLMLKTYAENVLKTSIQEIKTLPPDSSEPDKSYYGIKTTDGGYFAAYTESVVYDDCSSMIVQSALAYGAYDLDCYESWIRDTTNAMWAAPKPYLHKILIYISAANERCDKIQKLAATMSGTTVNRDTSSKICKLTCTDE
ncbi:MAG: hypothetical protein K5912_00585 [Alphaproteobacteria bacterium]|nr:hypothetical protein [Alphaproteobacteria bacterium]